jgi:sulfur carrier protein
MQLKAGQRIEIAVNGETVETGAATLCELLAELGYEEGAVATARNGDFVPRSARAGTRLAAGDRLEIVSPRQGG